LYTLTNISKGTAFLLQGLRKKVLFSYVLPILDGGGGQTERNDRYSELVPQQKDKTVLYACLRQSN